MPSLIVGTKGVFNKSAIKVFLNKTKTVLNINKILYFRKCINKLIVTFAVWLVAPFGQNHMSFKSISSNWDQCDSNRTALQATQRMSQSIYRTKVLSCFKNYFLNYRIFKFCISGDDLKVGIKGNALSLICNLENLTFDNCLLIFAKVDIDANNQEKLYSSKNG